MLRSFDRVADRASFINSYCCRTLRLVAPRLQTRSDQDRCASLQLEAISRNTPGAVWGSRGREFKSRQPDRVLPSKSRFVVSDTCGNSGDVATGVAIRILTT